MLTQNAIAYTLKHLLSVALPTESPLSFSFQADEQWLSLTVANDCRIRIPLFSEEDYDIFMRGEATPVLLPSADRKVSLPFFRPQFLEGHSSEPQCNDGALELSFDILSPSFIMLSREEEYSELPRDVHDRFLYNYSLARRYEFIDIPLVDEYAMVLREWILAWLRPNITLKPTQGQIVPTHDIDHLYRFTGHLQAFKSIFGRDLLINKSLSQVRTSLNEYRAWRQDVHNDPYIKAIENLIQISKKNNRSSIFFFKAMVDGEADTTYDINDIFAKDIITKIQDAGMTVGIHGSYDSYNTPTRLQLEKRRLEEVAGTTIVHGRQHYLRFCQHHHFDKIVNRSIYGQSLTGKTKTTLQTWQHAGILHDYTLGYAEQPGFRCGTCHPYPLYDLDYDCETNIIEHPLIVMDGSLIDYLHLNIEDCNLLINKLKNRCLAVEGEFIILWHNHLLSRNYRKYFDEVYTTF